VHALKRLGLVGYLPATGFAPELETELQRLGITILTRHGTLLLAAGPPRRPAWAADVWDDPQELPAPSIARAAAQLRELQRNWVLLEPPAHYRRARLIAERLPYVRMRPLRFPEPPPEAPLGGWTLLDRERLLAAPTTANPFPHGEVHFHEDRLNPPNRAYLKLWEALSRLPERPQAGERAVDLGAAPGGWTWVLAQLGAEVMAVDKAPLAASIAALPEVTPERVSAFALAPQSLGPIDWLCSDLICYPQRLYRLICDWLSRGQVRNFVVTVKFQHTTDFEAQAAFAALPGSQLLHLHHNKHELTWMSLARWRTDPTSAT